MSTPKRSQQKAHRARIRSFETEWREKTDCPGHVRATISPVDEAALGATVAASGLSPVVLDVMTDLVLDVARRYDFEDPSQTGKIEPVRK